MKLGVWRPSEPGVDSRASSCITAILVANKHSSRVLRPSGRGKLDTPLRWPGRMLVCAEVVCVPRRYKKLDPNRAADWIKIGSIVRSERLAKYNRLLRIEEEIGANTKGW